MLSPLESLLLAEQQAEALFHAIESEGLIRPGISEKALSDAAFERAEALFGIRKYWHKRIVRAGRNTLLPYYENPPNLTLQGDDILFFDFGPIFEDWEADLGRTYVLGRDPHKLRIKHDVEALWYGLRDWYRAQDEYLTGAQFYAEIKAAAEHLGWALGGEMSGHIIGHFPHERLDKELKDNYIHPDNHLPMAAPDKSGQRREWILEVHLIDPVRGFGAFFEQLLTR